MGPLVRLISKQSDSNVGRLLVNINMTNIENNVGPVRNTTVAGPKNSVWLSRDKSHNISHNDMRIHAINTTQKLLNVQ